MSMMNGADLRRVRTIESGTCRLAEEIAGAVYLQLEAGTGVTRISAGRGPMNQQSAIRIGVIADTHGLFDPAIRRHFRGVDHILHAGDIGNRSVIEQLEQIAPVTAVSGNVDDDQCGFPCEAVIELAGRRIVIRHILYEGGKLTKDGRAFLTRERPDICIFGHTHQPKAEWFGKTLLFNPGSAGAKRFSLPRGIGFLTIQKEKVLPKLIHLSDKVNRRKRSTDMSCWKKEDTSWLLTHPMSPARADR
jgi:uncharacterized protein